MSTLAVLLLEANARLALGALVGWPGVTGEASAAAAAVAATGIANLGHASSIKYPYEGVSEGPLDDGIRCDASLPRPPSLARSAQG
jgi:hypothetical protein